MNLRRRIPSAFFSVIVAAAAASWLAAGPARLPRADADRYLEHVKFLASKEMRGRGAGMPELNRAAEYLAEQFRAYGLKPGAGDSFFQPFSVTTGAELGPDNSFVIRENGVRQELTPREDYAPLNFSAAASVSGPLVFAGYGISAEEHGYDDYFHFDVQDKIVIVLRYEPEDFSKEEAEGGKRYTHHAHLISKAINAREHGAKAVILVNKEPGGDEKDDLIEFGSVSGPDDAGIVMVHVKRETVDGWLADADRSLAELEKAIAEEDSPQTFSLPETLTASVAVDIEREKAQVNNVAAHLPGHSEEYVIIGAHYDHLGLGGEGSLAPSKKGAVHPGADDNASGTAALIELARLFAARAGELERGILFLAFAGEEIGLLGSSHWVNNPALPLENAVAMINMDMIGRVRDGKIYAGGVGTGAGLKALVEDAVSQSGLKADISELGASASDHTSFISKRIPSLFFFSGLHSDYHKPSDTWEKIHSEPAAKVVNLVADVAGRLIAAEEPPEFQKVKASKASMGDGAGRGYGPYFGSVPDFGQIENGVKFADIRTDSPADKAGIKPGDVLVRFGDREIKNLYDFTYALRDHKPGDVVEVVVLRDGEEMAAEVQLEERK